ncbi:unnamed protein product, partial [Heterosigma akashiwo]
GGGGHRAGPVRHGAEQRAAVRLRAVRRAAALPQPGLPQAARGGAGEGGGPPRPGAGRRHARALGAQGQRSGSRWHTSMGPSNKYREMNVLLNWRMCCMLFGCFFLLCSPPLHLQYVPYFLCH